MGKLATLAGLALTAMLWAGTINADLAKPQGQVVLTIGGAVSESNLDASEFFAASFLKSLEYGYDKAAGFDIAMLEALGMVKKPIKAEPWPAPVTFEGPKLSDVLAAAGWTGTKLTAVAMDGFAVEITAEDLAKHEWILTLKGNGDYLRIGGRGPSWIVYDVPGGKATEEDESRWPWAVLFIKAE